MNDKLAKVKKAYEAYRKGTCGKDEYHAALFDLNEPRKADEKIFFLLIAGNFIARLNGRMIIFTTETMGRMFHYFSGVGSDLIMATKSELLKQISPDSDIVVNPGVSSITCPGLIMCLDELPE